MYISQISVIRDRLGISQAEAAALLLSTRSHLSMAESGKRMLIGVPSSLYLEVLETLLPIQPKNEVPPAKLRKETQEKELWLIGKALELRQKDWDLAEKRLRQARTKLEFVARFRNRGLHLEPRVLASLRKMEALATSFLESFDWEAHQLLRLTIESLRMQEEFWKKAEG